MTPPTSAVRLSHDLCTNLASAEQREWLVTNGLGGFACGTVAGTLTRRYHGLLIAALSPPRARTLLITKIDEIARLEDAPESFALGANRWAGGAIEPQGFCNLTEFRLEGSIPVWTYTLKSAQLEKRIWMQHGANTTYVEYRLVQSAAPLDLECKILVNYRDFNNLTHANGWRMQIDAVPSGLRVTAFDHATPFYLRSAAASAELAQVGGSPPGALWYCNYELSQERDRGLDDCEDHLYAAIFRVTLNPGATASLAFSTDPNSSLDAAASLAAEQSRERDLLTRFAGAHSQTSPPPAAKAPAWIQQLVLAADQFLVSSGNNQAADAPCEIIAGYPWFGVWSRDAMISLPGLTLATGRPELARRLLRTFARQIDRGMLPNFFLDSGQQPEFNSADAPLWFIEALRQYVDCTRDLDFARELFPSAQNIISAYSQGTRYSIHVDQSDGLVHCGEPGTQLTWMDARVNGFAATPRVGKPVEINALWLNALAAAANLAPHCGVPAAEFQRPAEQARRGFSRFWNANANCCFDVIDGPNGNDASLRPNQIFAVSLCISALDAVQQRAVVEACSTHLLAPCGLRSVAPEDPKYRGHYDGPQAQRDAAYHQGTVWAWLLGPFIEAHWKVYRDRAAIDRILGSIASHLTEAGLGTISEIFDGDAPFTPRGCFAQAWSVAEILRSWKVVAG